MADTSLIDRHFAHCPDGSGTAADFHLPVLHSNQLLLLGSNLDRAYFHRGNIVRVDGSEFTVSFRVDARLLSLVIRVLRIAVVQHFPFGARRGWGGAAAVGVHRFE